MSDLWKKIHTYALANTGQNENKYLLEFSRQIPRYTTGCKCKEHWAKEVKANPPKYGPNGEFFAWTVEIHNQVNKRLGKPTLTVEQARKLYSK